MSSSRRNLEVSVFFTMACFCLMQCQQVSITSAQKPTEMNHKQTEVDQQSMYARNAWLGMDKDLKSAVGKGMKRLLPLVMREVYKKDITSNCMSALLQTTTGLRQSKLWAYQMLDASGKFPEGFLSGTLTSLGNFEECLNININETKLKMNGKYCMLHLIPPLPQWKPFSSLHLTDPELVNVSAPDSVITYLAGFIHNLHVTSIKTGLCVPHRCTTDDVNRLVGIIPEQLGLDWNFDVNHCETRTGTEFSTSQGVILYVFGIIVLLVVVGTIVDQIWSSEEMEQRNAKATAFHLLKSFSFPANAKKLSHYNALDEELSFVYGIVFFMFLWVAISNTFMYVNYDLASNFVEALKLVKSAFYEALLNRIIPVQVFLYLSGFITAYKWMKSPEQYLNVGKYIFKRYWRFTPAYALVIALVLITPSWGSGPSWTKEMAPLYNNCRDNWWYNILYINNFIPTERMCMDHTWLLAVDAQLHLIAIVVLIPLKLRPAIGLVVNLTLLVASLVTVALTNVYYDLPPNEMAAFLHPKDRIVYAEHSYYRVYTHVSVYCTGIFVGYLMAKNPNLKISKKTSWALWIVTGAGFLGAVCSVHEWSMGEVPSPLTGALYTTFSKVAEGSFLAWLTVACMTGHGGGMKSVFSWRPFAFFSRMTFIAYIMHVPIIIMVMGFKKTQVFVSEFEIFHLVLSHVAGTYIVTYILHVFLEAPFLSLTDVLRKRCREKTLNFSNVSENNLMTEKPIRFNEKENKNGVARGHSWKSTVDRSNC